RCPPCTIHRAWPRPVRVRCPSCPPCASACAPAPVRAAPALHAACTTRARAPWPCAIRRALSTVRMRLSVRPLPHAPPYPLTHTPTPARAAAPGRRARPHPRTRSGSLRPPHPLVVYAPIPVPAPLPYVRGGRSERARERAWARRAQARRVRERVRRAGVHGAGGAAVRRARGPHAVRRVRAHVIHCTCRAVCLREGRAAQADATYVRVLSALRTCARCPPLRQTGPRARMPMSAVRVISARAVRRLHVRVAGAPFDHYGRNKLVYCIKLW
ncbi:hypothetical protein GGX14DRAFT_678946, partial [Mycena pura]